MRAFSEIYELACQHKGGADQVEALLPQVKDGQELSALPDSYYLSHMSRRIFRAGLKHALVDSKWPNFEAVFRQFDPYYCAMLSEDDIDALMQDKQLIRHRGKLRTIPKNAQFILTQAKSFQSFGAYLAKWPSDQTVALWWELKKLAAHLGGNSGPAFLRMVNKDTFLFSRDVVAVLVSEGVIDGEPTSKKDMLRGQGAFLDWQQESGRSLCEISRIVSFTSTM